MIIREMTLRQISCFLTDTVNESNEKILWQCINGNCDLNIDGSSIEDVAIEERDEPCLISTLQPIFLANKTFYFETLITHVGSGKYIKIGYKSRENEIRVCLDRRLSTDKLKSGDMLGCRLRWVRSSSHIYYIIDYSKNGVFISSSDILEKIPTSKDDESTDLSIKFYPVLLIDSPGSILFTNFGEFNFLPGTGEILSWRGMRNEGNVQIEGSIIMDLSHIDNKKLSSVSTSQPIPKEIDTFYYESRIVQMGTKQSIRFGFCSNSNIVEYHGSRLMTGELKSGDTIGCRLKRVRISELDYYFVDCTKNGIPISSRVILERYPAYGLESIKIYPIISFNSPGLILSTNLGTDEYFLGNGNIYLIALLQ